MDKGLMDVRVGDRLWYCSGSRDLSPIYGKEPVFEEVEVTDVRRALLDVTTLGRWSRTITLRRESGAANGEWAQGYALTTEQRELQGRLRTAWRELLAAGWSASSRASAEQVLAVAEAVRKTS